MLDLLLQAIIAVCGTAVVTIVISNVIDKIVVREKVVLECPNAFKAVIKEKKKDAVDVGIFDKLDNHLKTIELKSEKGISENLCIGQIIYC